MPRKGSKQPYKPRVEYKYTVKDIADLGGMTRNALNVAKAHGKIDPGDFKSVINFLTRRIIDKRLRGDLFARIRGSGTQVSGKKTKNVSGRK